MFIKGINKEIKNSSFITIMGNSNDFILSKLFECEYATFVLNNHLSIFNGETVEDEIAFGLESKALKKPLMKRVITDYAKKFKLTHLLSRDPYSLGYSDKVKLKLCNALICRSKVVVLDEVLSELDKKDLRLCLKLLGEYKKVGGIIINITSNIEESLYGDEIIIYNNEEVALEGSTLSVLNEEKLMKRLALGLPFFVELSKYLIDYNVIDTYYLDSESLVNAIWK